METLICNLTGTTRREILNGREHIVAPVTMIVPGVLNGSAGPLLYSAEENSKRVDAWNGLPLTIYHPVDGKSARRKEILNSQGVGVVLNTVIENGILKAEAWFDIERLQSIDSRVLNSLNSGTAIELSTGLKVDLKPAAADSVFNGKSYTHLATNYEPDHLAVLPDQKGACSLQDGCGVLINEEGSVSSSSSSVSPTQSGKGANMDREKVIAGIIKNCECWSEEDKDVLNGFDDAKLKAIATGQAKAIADAQIANQVREGIELEEGILAFNSEDGSFSFKAPEKKQGEETGEIMNGAGTEMAETPKTAEEWLAAAPLEIRQVVNFAQGVELKAKKDLVDQLVANIEDEDRRQTVGNNLMKKTTQELEEMIELIPQKKEEEVTNQQPQPRRFDFSGASTPALVGNNGKEFKGEPMPVQNWDWSSQD